MHDDMGIIVIGRNEGERLGRCLSSVIMECGHVIYVDSASTDGSIELAQSLGIETLALDTNRPLNAARARHEGFQRLLTLFPELSYVMFIDGDCELVSGWLTCAQQALNEQSDVAVVCGRRREIHPERSMFNRLCDIEWNTPVGLALACGGDSVMRVSAYAQAGGFDPTVPAGEEPELCHRIRSRGWKILRLGADMTLHDANITRVSQWWRRCVRLGHAATHCQDRFGLEYFRKITRSLNVWTVLWPLTVAATGLIGSLVASLEMGAGLAALAFSALPAQMLRIGLRACRAGLSARSAAEYGVLIMLGKLPEAVGQWRYRAESRRGKKAGLIEYK